MDLTEINNTRLAIVALVAALAVLGIVAVTLVTVPLQIQQAEARGCESGLPNSVASFNTSKGRCFGH